MTKKKNLITALVLFTIVLCVGIVYAAVSGTLTFNGTATLGENVRLEIVDEGYNTLPSSDCDASIVVSPDGQTATITAGLAHPGDTITFTYKVKNTGSVAAAVTTVGLVPTGGTLDNEVVIGGTYSNITTFNSTGEIGVGVTTSEYTITVGWPVGEPFVSGDEEFTITLDYEAF